MNSSRKPLVLKCRVILKLTQVIKKSDINKPEKYYCSDGATY